MIESHRQMWYADKYMHIMMLGSKGILPPDTGMKQE